MELNKAFAEAYKVADEREYIDSVQTFACGVEAVYKTIPINTDTLTLFQLCIEHKITLHIGCDGIFVLNGDFTFYDDHATKETTTCAVMFNALCKLKNLGD